MDKKINKRGRKVLKQREKFREELIKIIANESEDFKGEVWKIYDFLLQSNNLNHHKNPILLFDGHKGNISDDSCSGHPDCWELEENSRTSKHEISLADVFGYKCWKRSSISPDQLQRLLKLGKIFEECGLSVYFVHISTWRKGYDYHVYSLGDISKIIGMDVNYNDDCFRIYIQKGKIFQHHSQIDN